MNRADLVRLMHMIDAAREAIAFVEGTTLEVFQQDRKSILAVVKAIEIVGEAAAQLAHETRQAYPEIPWAQLVGMRNRLTHAYFDINTEIVWNTVRNDLPVLLPQLQQLLSSEVTDDYLDHPDSV